MTTPTYASYLRLDELLSLQHPLTPADQSELVDSERLFIVVHQASETLLSQVLVDLRHVDDGRCGDGCLSRRVERASRLVDALAGQVRLLHQTLPQEDFLRFRDRFGTASGLDSAQFKELFTLVKRLTEQDVGDRSPEMARALGELKAAGLRWRSTHLELVGDMLGNLRGTGDTSGAGFLAARLDDASATEGPAEPRGRRDQEEAPAAEPARTPAGRPPFGHVVVVGGSVAGLLTAHVLADHAERVTLVERDRYEDEDDPAPRAGVPQSRHTHVLLTSGMNALDELLPGLLSDLATVGAPRLAIPGDLGVLQAGQWISRRNPSAPIMTPSRPLLDHGIRKRVLADPRVRVRTGVETTGLLGRPDHVTGVVLRDRDGDHQDLEELPADLVVDATGRASRTPRWLTELGGRAPDEELVETGRAYATCVFHADDPDEALKGFYIVPDGGQPLGAIILPAEGDRWMVTLSGPRDQPPPTDPEGFVDFAGLLPHPAPHKWLSAARPITRPAGYRHTSNQRRRYDRLGRNRTGLLVVGDAACALNPVYGQGLSAAALNAVALKEALAGGRTPSVDTLQRAVLRSSRSAWEVATGADSSMPGVAGNAVRTGAVNRLLNRYVDRVRDRVPSDPVVCTANRDVLFLLKPPSHLVTSPRVLLRTLLSSAVPTPRDLPTL